MYINGSRVGDCNADAEVEDECCQKLGPHCKHRGSCQSAQQAESELTIVEGQKSLLKVKE